MNIPIIGKWIQKRYTLKDTERWAEMISSGRSATGKVVTPSTALQSVAVFACVRVLSETLASLPLPVYRRLTPRGKERALAHYLYPILHDAPNPEMTSFVFREALMGHLALWGNAYAEIDWDPRSGKVNALWPLRPDRMQVVRENGQLWYRYRLPDGDGAELPAYRVLHIPGMGFDGIMGYSPVQLAREAIGLGLAAEEFGARLFSNDTNLGGYLRHPKTISEPAQERLLKSFEKRHQGLEKSHRLAVLEEGMEYQRIGIPPNDAQFLETRKFQTSEIARFFNVPPHMIGDLDRATFSNIEQQSLEFVVYTLTPWLKRWEQSIAQKLLGPSERRTYFAEFLVSGLLRGDIQARFNAYAVGRQWGWLSADDVRDLENMNPLPDGQGNVYLIPMNMLPADMATMPEEPASEESNSYLREVRVRAAKNRHRTAQSFRRVFEDAARRIVDREREGLLPAAEKHLTERSVESWDVWMERFYGEFSETAIKLISPAVRALAEAIQPLAADEVNGLEGMTPEMERFLERYARAFAARYVQSSQGQLRAIVRTALDEGEDMIEAVSARTDEWWEKRPGKVSLNETVQLSNAVAKTVFAAAGVVRLRWQALGSEACPLCQEMNGRVVGIGAPFLPSDGILKSEAGSEIKAYRPTMQPPLHQGCVCQIVPG